MSIVFLVFIFGLVVGSFLNVVILRGAAGQSLTGRSCCQSCQKILSWSELIPVFSFVIQKGRCRNCGVVLYWQYPLIELATGIFYAGAVYLFYPVLSFDVWSVVLIIGSFAGIGAGIVIFVSDLKYQIIPFGPAIVLFLLSLTVAVWRAIYLPLWSSSVLGSFLYDLGAAFIFSLFFASLWFFSRGRWMGLGDAKLVLATSLIVGFPMSLTAFLFSFWLGGVAGLVLLAFRKKEWQSRLPFGPFILIGTALAYFYSAKFLALTGLTELIYLLK